MKPVELFAYLINNSTRNNEIVLDSFAGSGTTIIACEITGRVGHCVELDEKYVDVIVKRYKALGKEDIILERDGRLIQYEEIKELLI